MKSQKNTLTYNRFGFVVGKSVDALATERNSLKRRVRSLIEQQLLSLHQGYDVLFVLRPAAKSCSPVDLLAKIRTGLQKAGIL